MTRLALAQINPTVGALEANRVRVARALAEARRLGAHAVLFPELALSGYPPEDLLKNGAFLADARAALEALQPETHGLLAIVGLPLQIEGELLNAAAVLLDGRWVDTYAKGTLPNYGVFDEKRYFRPGLRCPVYQWRGLSIGVQICEDLWPAGGVPRVQASAGASWLWNLSASPYQAGKGRVREALLRRRARTYGTAIAYCNLVGGQDELVFDGESLVVDATGTVRARARQFQEALLVVDLDPAWIEPDPASGSDPEPFTDPEAEPIAELEGRFEAERIVLESVPGLLAPSTRRGSEPEAADPALPPIPASNRGVSGRLEGEAEIYEALKLGLADYIRKNGFRTVALGLSGGIDSALTAAIAADALGAAQVTGVSMPSRFNSSATRTDAALVAANLGLNFLEIPIEPAYQAFLTLLRPVLGDDPPGVTEENVQARVRAVLLMAISNRTGALILTTGNKSELAVGYCTLYGDMAGGLAVIKDVPKTMVYRLARYRNTGSPVIPEETIARAPSAELRDNQKDTDTLPPYDLLDAIVQARMEDEADPAALIAGGLDPEWVHRVYRWIDANEYKRRQAPAGIRITPGAFGRDRRYPITNGYRWRR